MWLAHINTNRAFLHCINFRRDCGIMDTLATGGSENLLYQVEDKDQEKVVTSDK